MNRRKFLNYIGCGCSGLMLGACSTAPITDRRQLKIIPESKLNAQAAQIFEKVKEKEKMSDDIKTLNEIKDIGKRMEDSISEYFYKVGLNDPTANFDSGIIFNCLLSVIGAVEQAPIIKLEQPQPT